MFLKEPKVLTPILAAMSAPLVRQGSGANLHRKTFTDPGVDVSDLAGSLSPFQIEKLTYLFKCLDQNGSGIFDVRISTMYLSLLLMLMSILNVLVRLMT